MDDLSTGGVLEDFRPALAAFLQKVVKLLRLSLESKLAAVLRFFKLPELELELESSSCELLVRWKGMGEGMGVGMGEGNSLMGDKHLPKLKPGTSKVIVGATL